MCFDEPVGFSLVRLLNYSKDPARGVHEFELLADGLLVYRGWLRKGDASGPAAWQSVVLSNHEMVVQQERGSGRLAGVHAAERGESPCDVTLLFDEGNVMNKHAEGGVDAYADVPPAAVSEERPTTACPPRSARGGRRGA